MNSVKQKRVLGNDLEHISTWPGPDIFSFNEEDRQEFARKKLAVELYAEGASLKDISLRTQIPRQTVLKLVKRCLILNDGGLVGFYGLIKGAHLAPNHRSASIQKLDSGKPFTGSLKALFLKYPSLKEAMTELILKGKTAHSIRKNSNLSWAQIHHIFLTECSALGISPTSYPFCSDSQGAMALQKWAKNLRSSFRKIPYQLLNDEESHFHDAPSTIYEKVELDGHYVDLNWKVEIKGLQNEILKFVIKRLWLIALIERKSTAVLGYSVCLGKNYDSASVAQAIQNTLIPWKPRDLSISTITYKPGECMPSFYPELAFICYDELWLDNAKSHLSDLFLTVLERNVNAVPVFGPKGSPNVRPRVEGLFALLEEAGFHSIDGTTGSNSRDPRGMGNTNQDFTLSLDVVLDLIDLLICRYNNDLAPSSSVPRNELLRRAVQRESSVIRRIPQSRRDQITKFFIFEEAVIGRERGKPILRWKGARYDAIALHQRSNLIGEKVLVMAAEDIRTIHVVLLKDGSSLGEFNVERRFRNEKNTIFTRKLTKKIASTNSFIKHSADLTLAVRKHLENNYKDSLRNQRDLARLVRDISSPDKNANMDFSTDFSEATELSVQTEMERDKEQVEEQISEIDRFIDGLHSSYR